MSNSDRPTVGTLVKFTGHGGCRPCSTKGTRELWRSMPNKGHSKAGNFVKVGGRVQPKQPAGYAGLYLTEGTIYV